MAKTKRMHFSSSKKKTIKYRGGMRKTQKNIQSAGAPPLPKPRAQKLPTHQNLGGRSRPLPPKPFRKNITLPSESTIREIQEETNKSRGLYNKYGKELYSTVRKRSSSPSSSGYSSNTEEAPPPLPPRPSRKEEELLIEPKYVSGLKFSNEQSERGKYPPLIFPEQNVTYARMGPLGLTGVRNQDSKTILATPLKGATKNKTEAVKNYLLKQKNLTNKEEIKLAEARARLRELNKPIKVGNMVFPAGTSRRSIPLPVKKNTNDFEENTIMETIA